MAYYSQITGAFTFPFPTESNPEPFILGKYNTQNMMTIVNDGDEIGFTLVINQFDLTQVVPDFDMTIDQMLVYIPQLTARKKKLDHMRSNLPKERITSFSSNFVEYNYSNYDIEQAEADYEKAADELARAQTALDTVNTTVEFEV